MRFHPSWRFLTRLLLLTMTYLSARANYAWIWANSHQCIRLCIAPLMAGLVLRLGAQGELEEAIFARFLFFFCFAFFATCCSQSLSRPLTAAYNFASRSVLPFSLSVMFESRRCNFSRFVPSPLALAYGSLLLLVNHLWYPIQVLFQYFTIAVYTCFADCRLFCFSNQCESPPPITSFNRELTRVLPVTPTLS